MQPRKTNQQSGWPLTIKVMLDKLVAALLLIVLSPVLLIIAFLVWFRLGSPIFYRQTRPGRNAKLFTIVKFRTMKQAASPQEELISDADRIRPFGRFLRSFSLDELPELWNVLRGDMSLVGPRPLLVQYVNRYTQEQARRHEVLPGITGWAQVNGRNDLTWERKFDLDVWYVDHWSLILDLKILFRTVVSVTRRQGISLEGHATTTEFMGSRPPAPTNQVATK
jgi:lipopolysaccharide/colanic/teichoic acid biosynthesis glycosyltransferase